MMMPTIPPESEMMIASVRNCARISALVAPTALRTPISRVRAFTVASMMFMMPTPLTISVSTEISSSTVVSVLAVWAATFSNCVRLSTRYTDSGRWRDCNTSCISCVARGTSFESDTEKNNCFTSSVLVK